MANKGTSGKKKGAKKKRAASLKPPPAPAPEVADLAGSARNFDERLVDVAAGFLMQPGEKWFERC